MKTTEYRVRPVVRFVVTMHTECATSVVGEYDNEFYANMACEALNGHEFEAGQIVADRGRWEAHIRMEQDARDGRHGNDSLQSNGSTP